MTLPRYARWAFLALGTWLALAAVRNAFFTHADLGPAFSRFAHDVALVGAGGLCLARAASRREERMAWVLMGAGILAWTSGEIYYTSLLWTAEVVPIPSPADVGYLLMPLLVLAGLVGLLRSRTTALPPTLAADGITAALAVGAMSAAVVFDTALDAAEGPGIGVAVTLAYPLLDLALLGVLVGGLAATGWRVDRTWGLLSAGILLFWLADSAFLIQTARDTFVSDTVIDLGWWIGLTLIALAAWQPGAPAAPATLRKRVRLIVMPLAFALISLATLVYGCFAAVNPLAVALAGLALLAVMARLALTFRENTAMLHFSRGEALTDPLTGLANRRALAQELERVLPQAGAEAPVVLAVFDLDGFKFYNDTFGHPAGDALLVRLAANLQRHLTGRGQAFRMGGDEFCALFAPGHEVYEPIVTGAAAALSEHGEGFRIGCSYGAILLPLETGDAAEALRIADGRMYAQKHAGRVSAGRQSTDVLLRALAERNPELSSHVHDVAELADAVARRLALPDDQVQQIRHAAELHDVGKVAIPDDILHKPGPLDDEEWSFIRRHTLIGERIIAAAPALREVARLVRSSHERWDGTGYPDHIAGSDIPLGSRIVSVADAFDAMTASRPYTAARPPEAALEELRRCAGTQFDPMVVEAFAAAWVAYRPAAVGTPVA